MKKGLSVLLFSFISLVSFGQIQKEDLQKLWKINNILGFQNQLKGLDEYKIFPISEDKGFAYGNLLKINDDNTFQSYYTAPCGNDVFPETFGTYEFINENHIRFRLDSAALLNTYSQKESFNKKVNVDLGIFIVDKTSEGFRFIRSVSDVKDDIRKSYSDIVDSVLINTDKYCTMVWSGKLKPTDRSDNYTKDFEIGLTSSNIFDKNECQLVYTTEKYFRIFYLFKYRGETYFVQYEPGPLGFYIYKVNSIGKPE